MTRVVFRMKNSFQMYWTLEVNNPESGIILKQDPKTCVNLSPGSPDESTNVFRIIPQVQLPWYPTTELAYLGVFKFLTSLWPLAWPWLQCLSGQVARSSAPQHLSSTIWFTVLPFMTKPIFGCSEVLERESGFEGRLPRVVHRHLCVLTACSNGLYAA